MQNTISAGDIKRRGMAAIEEGLRRGPVHLLKHNQPAAVVITEAEYQRLLGLQPDQSQPGMTAFQWLVTQAGTGTRDKADIDRELDQERSDWWKPPPGRESPSAQVRFRAITSAAVSGR